MIQTFFQAVEYLLPILNSLLSFLWEHLPEAWLLIGVTGAFIHYLSGGLSSSLSSEFKWDTVRWMIIGGPISVFFAIKSWNDERRTTKSIRKKGKEEAKRVKKLKPTEQKIIHSKSTGLPFEKDTK